MARIGYMEGTDPELLDKLALQGYKLIPLGDESDGYAKHLFHVTRLDRIDLVLTRFYKLSQLSESYGISEPIEEIFARWRETNTFLLIISPVETESMVKDSLGDQCLGQMVKLVPPGKLFGEVVASLENVESPGERERSGPMEKDRASRGDGVGKSVFNYLEEVREI